MEFDYVDPSPFIRYILCSKIPYFLPRQVRASTLNSVVYAKEVGQWAAEPGPLTLVGIDTGFGYLHVDSRGLTHVLLPEVTINLLRLFTSGVDFT